MSQFHPGCVAFVTGAASGIGLATAKRLLADGITNLALLDVPSDAFADPLQLSAPHNSNVLRITCDVSKEDDVVRAVENVVEHWGRIDVAFLCAGISGPIKPFEETGTEVLDKVLGINLRGVWLCQREIVKVMLKQEERPLTTGLPFKARGSIVNVGSICSHKSPIPSLSPYVMAKHGVLGLTKSTAADLGGKGIRVNCICPGWIKTGMTEQAFSNKEASAATISNVPMARWGTPEEVAFLTSFLLSDKASYMTGGSYTVDGGIMAN